MTDRSDLGGVLHLSRRFCASLSGAGPEQGDVDDLNALLSESEAELFASMPAQDQRHAISAAKAARQLGGDSETVVASALHDVGKTPSGLGTLSRVAASLAVLLAGRQRVAKLQRRSGYAGRIGRYAAHPEIGAQLLRDAASSDLAVAWAAEHHHSAKMTSIDPELFELLERADRA